MTKQIIVAPDVRTAMREVKERYGEDALILDTRTRRSRESGSLQGAREVEITVGLAGPEAPARARSVADELDRLEALLAELEAREASLRAREATLGDGAAPPAAYPLDEALEDCGVSAATRRRLAADHEMEVPPVDQADPGRARERLAAHIRCVEAMDLADLRGRHTLLGRPGAGRSTLALKLAARAARAGVDTLLIAHAPGHPGEAVRLERAAEAAGFAARLTADDEALLATLAGAGDRELVLVDLPPLAKDQWELLSRAEAVLAGEPLLRHLVVPADGGWRGLETAASRCDFLAISRADLGVPLAPCLDLAPAGDFTTTFVGSGPGMDGGLSLAQAPILLVDLERPRASQARRAEAGSTP
ncbi:MAG: hypothetical protein JW819_01180 [Candidatus Krumholzibacteriota bacterium]|nr:hypothetical protein [Candidatus Krumholzibacteriota bacterium]